jgi:hypothetical protein
MSPIDAQVSQLVSAFEIIQEKFCMHFSFTMRAKCIIIVTCMCDWLQTGFELVNGFTNQSYTRFVITSNYRVTANIHNSQITTAPAKSFPACCVFTSRSLAMSYDNGDSSASRAQIRFSQPHAELFVSNLVAPSVFKITPWQGPHRKHHSSIVARVFVAAGTCLSSCCPETSVVYLPISQSFIIIIIISLQACYVSYY